MKRLHPSKTHSISLTSAEFHEIISDAYIIDVRSNAEILVLPTINNSVNIYVSKLVKNPQKYVKNHDQLIVTYCNAGNRSGYAADELRRVGYPNAYVLKDGVYGYERWLKHHHKNNKSDGD